MARLFLIGNGYDVAHNLNSRYKDFRDYLRRRLDEILNSKQYAGYFVDLGICTCEMMKCVLLRKHLIELMEDAHENIQPSEEIAEEIDILPSWMLLESMDLLDDAEWNDFENNLARLPLKELAEKLKNCHLLSENGNCSPVDWSIDHVCDPKKIYKLFIYWVESLENGNKKLFKRTFDEQVIERIEEDDIFVTFNYTKTIERLFGLCSDDNRICHIHGTIVDDADKKIVVGHNNKHRQKCTPLDDENDYINETYATLYKNPETIIKNNEDLWDRIRKSDGLTVYEYGWKCTCGSVDDDYVKKIVEILNEKIMMNQHVEIYFNNYNGEGLCKATNWIKNHHLLLDKGQVHLYRDDKNAIVYDEYKK